MNLERIYSSLPIFLQNAACSVIGWKNIYLRYGMDFEKLKNNITSRQFLNSQELYELQKTRLKQHFAAAQGSSFWLKRFNQYNLNINAEDPFIELSKLPILTKQEVQNNTKNILNSHFNVKSLNKHYTSGTTGAGLEIYDTKDANIERWAIWWRYRNTHGITRKTKCAYFGGRSIVPSRQQKAPFWRYNKPENQILFSAYHLSSNTIREYIEAFQDFNPTWIHGYPSQLVLFATLIKDYYPNFEHNVKVITIGSESLLSHQKQTLEETFNCPVRQHYGLQESVANISECSHGHLHVDEDLSYVEFVKSGQNYKVIGTNWNNPAFPLFRYDTNDLVSLTEEDHSCQCGRNGRLIDTIDGRKEDYIILPNGVKIGRLDHIFKKITSISEAQIVQYELDQVTINIKPNAYYNDDSEIQVLEEAKKRLGDSLNININVIENIPKTSSGKLRFVINKLPEDIKNKTT